MAVMWLCLQVLLSRAIILWIITGWKHLTLSFSLSSVVHLLSCQPHQTPLMFVQVTFRYSMSHKAGSHGAIVPLKKHIQGVLLPSMSGGPIMMKALVICRDSVWKPLATTLRCSIHVLLKDYLNVERDFFTAACDIINLASVDVINPEGKCQGSGTAKLNE